MTATQRKAIAERKEMQRRKNLVKIGQELGMLNESDESYILDLAHTYQDAERRMITARHRKI